MGVLTNFIGSFTLSVEDDEIFEQVAKDIAAIDQESWELEDGGDSLVYTSMEKDDHYCYAALQAIVDVVKLHPGATLDGKVFINYDDYNAVERFTIKNNVLTVEDAKWVPSRRDLSSELRSPSPTSLPGLPLPDEAHPKLD